MAIFNFPGKPEKPRVMPGLVSTRNSPATVLSTTALAAAFKPNKQEWIEEKIGSVLIQESSKGQISTSIGFQKGISEKKGEERPYDYGVYEAIYTSVPMAKAATELTIDFTVSKGLYVTAEDENVVDACDDFMHRLNFDLFLRRVVKHMLIYGDCFVEIVTDSVKDEDSKKEMQGATDIVDLKILHPRTMKVKRDEFGNVKGYIQELGTGQTPVEFEKEEIAHFIYDQVGDRAYGTSMYEPLLTCLKIKLQMERDMGFLVERKANAPYHIKIGSDEYPAIQGDIDSFASELAALKARNEWVTSHLIDIQVVGFQGKILDLKPFSEHFDNQIVYGLRVPYVLLGLGNIPEGLARVQQETFDRHTQSIQLSVQTVLEQEIFAKVVNIYKLDEIPRLEWGKQSEEENQTKIEYYLKLLSSPLSEDTKTWIENKIRDLLGIRGQITEEQRASSFAQQQQFGAPPKKPGAPGGDEKKKPEKPPEKPPEKTGDKEGK